VSQPQPAFQIQPVTPDPAPSQSRETWGGKYEFLLSCIGYCVGLGNVWRFPYLCYRNGGGVFLIPYFIMLLFTGLPLFLLELSLGQYGAAGPITVWKCCPLLKGIGVGMLLVSSLVSLYYNVIIAWTFYYLGMSFQSPLPWSCDAPQNAPLCQVCLFPPGRPLHWGGTHQETPVGSVPASEQVLGVTHSSGLHDPGPVRWPLAICLLVAWIVIFLCMLKGIRSSGKVTARKEHVRGEEGAGSQRALPPPPQVWNDAASQIFYSLGIGFGGLLSMASYNKFDNNVIRDTLVIAIGNCCTSFFAGFAIFSILGHMAWRKRVPVGQVADSGPGLAFVAYPEALALLPASAFWSVLFFLMMFTLGVDTLFGNMEGITTAMLDEFPALRGWRRKTLFLGALCFIFYLLGLLLITEGGIYWFTLIDAYSTSFGLIIITLFMLNQFCRDIVDMICRCPPWCSKLVLYFKACWVFITPCLLLMYSTSLHYGAYVYPRWGKALGVCMGTVTCIQIPLWALVAICRESGTLTDVSAGGDWLGRGNRPGLSPPCQWQVDIELISAASCTRAAHSRAQPGPPQFRHRLPGGGGGVQGFSGARPSEFRGGGSSSYRASSSWCRLPWAWPAGSKALTPQGAWHGGGGSAPATAGRGRTVGSVFRADSLIRSHPRE
uniref:Transporter n=1 Tax=Chelonoidis abingdonii TaxID=106734 RepID=A0A8C0QJP3_CHEAB